MYLIAIGLSGVAEADGAQRVVAAGQLPQRLMEGRAGLAQAAELALFWLVHQVAHDLQQRAAQRRMPQLPFSRTSPATPHFLRTPH